MQQGVSDRDPGCLATNRRPPVALRLPYSLAHQNSKLLRPRLPVQCSALPS